MPNESLSQRSIRQQALQLLCQFDAGNEDVACVAEDPFDEDTSSTVTPNEKAFKLAKKIWEDKISADAQIELLTPDWPIHRQPLIDRNILRLARYEIITGMTPPIVAIDEAIELARIFSTEHSSTFINGVLDTLYNQSKPFTKTVNGES
ncbi:MAG: transcription antitermination factor NusB [Phycisphaerales bacterium]|nr:transcription antitermination factor NusB [Planctomycetota bacterium]MBL6997466.1 transcription antitermination factor NusB [Phycisphaerales bacterium]